jgi:ligand-binding sensor domain-containing protein
MCATAVLSPRRLITPVVTNDRFLILILIASLSFFTPDTAAQYSPYRQVNSLNSKLSSENIRTIVQDKKGFLWIGTDDGLNRYDGYTFTVYKNIPGDSRSIIDNEVYTLANDSLGNLWVGFSNGNVSYYNYETDRFYHIEAATSGIAKNSITRIFFDRTGRMWVAVVQNGLYYLDTKTKRFIKAGDLPDIHKGYKASLIFYKNYNSIYDIHEDGNGVFWLATHDGLYQFFPKSNLFQSIRHKEVIPFKDRFDLFNDILPAKDGFWLSSWGGGLTHYNQQNGEWKNYRMTTGSPGTHNVIQSIEWKNDDQLWFASNDFGLGYFDIDKEEFNFINTKPCQKLLKDRTGGLWVTSALEGLLQFDPFTLFTFQKTNVTHSDNGEYFFTNGFYHDIKNRVLYYGASFGDGLHVYDEKTKKETVYPFDVLKTSEKIHYVSDIYKDARDSLWILTNDYIYLFDERGGKLKKFRQPFDHSPKPDSQISLEFYRMIRARNGDLWITTAHDGVFRYNFHDDEFSAYTDREPNGILSNTARGIEEDAYGRIWLINGSRVSIFNYKDNSFHSIESYVSSPSDLNQVVFFDITSSPEGDIWMTSDRGIFQYDHKWDSVQLKHWTSKEQIPNGKLKYIQVDGNGLVWFQTTSNLWCLNPEKKRIVYSVGTQNHFSSSGLYIDDNNQIYLGAYAGYNTFNPSTAFDKAKAPPLVITSFYANNQKILIDSLKGNALQLDYNQNSITIQFSALNFQNSSKNKYAFMLDGVDQDWSPGTERHLVNYGNLLPGKYTFKVKGATQEEIWSEPLQLQFEITPPFWLTYYFLIAAVLVLSYIAFLLFKWRTMIIQKRTAVKSDFEKKILETEMSTLRAQMNPHFIFNSLNSVNHYILMADRDTASFYLTKFSKLIRLILENSNKSRISLDQELVALKHYIDMELLRFDHSFSYNIQIDPDVDPISIQFPPLMIQPYVENSIWHGFHRRTRYGVLTITINKESSKVLVITVEDNGVGRNSAKPKLETSSKKSHGLKITQDRLSILTREGFPSSVEIIDLKNESNEPLGTKVVIRITVNEFNTQTEPLIQEH